MAILTSQVTESKKKSLKSFADFCVYDSWKCCDEKNDKSFVGIKFENNQPKIYFPMGYRLEKPSEENICKQDFFCLISVLSDPLLQKYFSEEDLKNSHLNFPFQAFLFVLQYYLDYGCFFESEPIYKKSFAGKISWSRTIKNVKPQVIKNEDGTYQVVYLDLIMRKSNCREDNLITLMHKYCVRESAKFIGPLYGISKEEVEKPEIEFDYDFFMEVIQDKISTTFNDKHLELFQAMVKIICYLGNKKKCGECGEESDSFFGVNTFAPIWEGMVDRIFGNLPQGWNKSDFNPHLKFVIEGAKSDDGVNYQDENDKDEMHRSTLRPDTIMVVERESENAKLLPCNDNDGVYILDSKYYKYGLTQNLAHMPGADSVCKQMAYAEYVKMKMKTENVYNAFIMPYCADARNLNEFKVKLGEKFGERDAFKMCCVGYIYGDWKDRSKPYHKIHCVFLDMKSVMRNYTNISGAQTELARRLK